MLIMNSIIKKNVDIETVEMNGELGMINVETGKYFVLNNIGLDIWNAIGEGVIFEDLIDNLINVYDVSKEVCYQDTYIFVNELIKSKVLYLERS